MPNSTAYTESESNKIFQMRRKKEKILHTIKINNKMQEHTHTEEACLGATVRNHLNLCFW